MSGETLRAPRQQLRPLRASDFRFPRISCGFQILSHQLARSHRPQHNSSRLRRGGTWIQRWRVPLGFVCAAVFLLLARPRALTLAAGGSVALLGLGLRAWASGHVRKNHELAISGPYAYTRNPLYLGSFIIGLGFTIAAGRWILAAIFLLLFVCIYVPVMRIESRTLSRLFAESYSDYARQVPMFLPRLTPYRTGDAERSRFDIGLYVRYREYQASLGLLVAWVLLALKALYLK